MASKKKTKKKSVKETKGIESFPVNFTKLELVHLRDLFSIVLPVAMNSTVSQRLAQAEGRPMIEALLWQKLVTACEAADIALNDDAPDYVVGPASTPEISVFPMAHDPGQVHHVPIAPDEEEIPAENSGNQETEKAE
jgi:hypothetical protein